MPRISVANIPIEVVRKDIKHLHLGVYPPEGRVRISAPLRFSSETIRLFAVSRIVWIKKQKLKFAGQERQPRRDYVSGESHYFQGKRYLLSVAEQDAPPKVNIRRKAYIDLYVRPGSPKIKRQEVLNIWYRTQLKAIVPDLIAKWQKIIGVQVADWGIKAMRTRWGTCNSKTKRIWLNLELAKKPVYLLEYILVHEMVHLLERHHGQAFIAHMDKLVPRWPAYKQELNKTILGHVDWN